MTGASRGRPRLPRAGFESCRAARRHRHRHGRAGRRVGLVLDGERLVCRRLRAPRRTLIAGLRTAPDQQRARPMRRARHNARRGLFGDQHRLHRPVRPRRRHRAGHLRLGRRPAGAWRKAPGSHLAEGVDEFSIVYFDDQGRTLAACHRRRAARRRPCSRTARRAHRRGPLRVTDGEGVVAGLSAVADVRRGARAGGQQGYALLAALLIAAIALLATATLVAAALSTTRSQPTTQPRRAPPTPPTRASSTPSSACAGAGWPSTPRRCPSAWVPSVRRRFVLGHRRGVSAADLPPRLDPSSPVSPDDPAVSPVASTRPACGGRLGVWSMWWSCRPPTDCRVASWWRRRHPGGADAAARLRAVCGRRRARP